MNYKNFETYKLKNILFPMKRMSQIAIAETTPLLNFDKKEELVFKRSPQYVVHKILLEPQTIAAIKNGSKHIIIFDKLDKAAKNGDYIYLVCKSREDTRFKKYTDLPLAYDNLKVEIVRITPYKGLADCYKNENIKKIYPWVNSIDEAIEFTKFWDERITDNDEIKAIEFKVL